MKHTCTECGISYSADMDACPWCGHVRLDELVDEVADVAPTAAGDAQSVVDQVEPDIGQPELEPELPPPSEREPFQAEEPVESAPPIQPPPPEDVVTEDAASPTIEVLAHSDEPGVRPARVVRREMTELLSDGQAPPGPPPPPGRPKPGPSKPAGPAPTPTTPRWKKWITTAAIAAALIVVGALVAEFYPIGSSDTAAGSTVPSPETTDPTDGSTSPSTSTTPGESSQPATTLEPGVISPIGSAIAIEELHLAADAIGPLDFGIAGDEAVGRLVASFGQPDEDSGVVAGDPSLGICAADQMRTYRWGGLTVVLRAANGVETFVGYRLSLAGAGGHATAGVKTLSGLALGDTVETLQGLYSGLTVQLTEREGAPAFELYGNSDGLLLWGKVTSTDADGTVETIQSPLECSQ